MCIDFTSSENQHKLRHKLRTQGLEASNLGLSVFDVMGYLWSLLVFCYWSLVETGRKRCALETRVWWVAGLRSQAWDSTVTLHLQFAVTLWSLRMCQPCKLLCCSRERGPFTQREDHGDSRWAWDAQREDQSLVDFSCLESIVLLGYCWYPHLSLIKGPVERKENDSRDISWVVIKAQDKEQWFWF